MEKSLEDKLWLRQYESQNNVEISWIFDISKRDFRKKDQQ